MDFELWPLGDAALLVRLSDRIDAGVNAEVHQALAALRRASLPGVVALAPAYASLVLRLDLAELARDGGTASLSARVREVLAEVQGEAAGAPRCVDIPTRYGGEDGPDLEWVAQELGTTTAAIVECHAGASYRVAMLGFRPGFPYLLGLPDALRLPRRASVRARVPAGSVAIAGAQAGIYPGESPGGWHLLGRTTLNLFDPARTPPSLLLPGDRVRFVPVA